MRIAVSTVASLAAALLVGGCKWPDIGCSHETMWVAEEMLIDGALPGSPSYRLELDTEVHVLPSTLRPAAGHLPESTVTLWFENDGGIPRTVNRVSLRYALTNGESLGSFETRLMTTEDCGVAGCVNPSGDPVGPFTLPSGASAARVALDFTFDGRLLGDAMQEVLGLELDLPNEKVRRIEHRTDVVRVERAINCIVGIGHSYRRVES